MQSQRHPALPQTLGLPSRVTGSLGNRVARAAAVFFAFLAPLGGGGLALAPLVATLPFMYWEARRATPWPPQLALPAAVLSGVSALSALLGVDRAAGLAHSGALAVMAATGLLGARVATRDRSLFEGRMLPAALLSTAFVAAYAMYQYFGLHMPRATGLGNFPNRLGALLVFFGFLGFGYLLDRPGAWRWIAVPFAALVIGGLGVSQSRAAWVSAAVGAAIMALRWGRRGASVFLGIALLGAGWWALQPGWTARLLSIFDVERNLDRITLWWTALRIFVSSPIVGRGPGSFPHLQAAYMPATGYTEIHATPHNLLLALAADTGILGLAGFGWVAARAAHMGWRLWRRGDLFCGGLVAATAALFVSDLFSQGFYTVDIGAVMWFSLGLVEALFAAADAPRPAAAAGKLRAPAGRLTVSGSDTPGPSSISVVLPVRNRAGLLRACLECLMRAGERVAEQGVAVEIVVADDASTDDTANVLAQTASRSPIPIRVVRLATRQGPGRARNAAIEQSQGELIVFVDSDVLVDETFLDAHLATHRQAGPVIYTVGPLIAVPSVQQAGQKPGATLWDFSSAPLDTANAAVLKEHLKAVGCFDPAFKGMGWQDIDLGMRLRAYGLKRIVVKAALGYHIQPPIETEAQLEARIAKERERGESAAYFLTKHPGLEARLATQDTALHRGLNWLFRMGGLVHRQNVLAWMGWARRHHLVALEKMWLAGVVNKAYLDSLAAKRRKEAGDARAVAGQ